MVKLSDILPKQAPHSNKTAMMLQRYAKIDPDDIPKRLNASKNFLEFTRGNAIKSYIREGSEGEIYYLSDGNVIKITREKSEAEACSLLMKKEAHPNTLVIFDVCKFIFDTGNPLYDDKNCYVYLICEEPLKRDPKITAMLQGAAGEVIDGVVEANEYLRQDEVESKVYSVINDGNIDVTKEEEKLATDIISGFYFLQNNGIDWGDIHKGNVMKRGEDYVVIDYGGNSHVHVPGEVRTINEDIL